MIPPTLHSCPQCASFNPSSASHCVSCDAPFEKGPQASKRTSTLLKTAGLVAMSVTLTACYGGGMDSPIPNCIDDNHNGYCDFEPCDDPDYEGECEPLNVFCDEVSSALESPCNPSEPEAGVVGGQEEPVMGGDSSSDEL